MALPELLIVIFFRLVQISCHLLVGIAVRVKLLFRRVKECLGSHLIVCPDRKQDDRTVRAFHAYLPVPVPVFDSFHGPALGKHPVLPFIIDLIVFHSSGKHDRPFRSFFIHRCLYLSGLPHTVARLDIIIAQEWRFRPQGKAERPFLRCVQFHCHDLIRIAGEIFPGIGDPVILIAHMRCRIVQHQVPAVIGHVLLLMAEIDPCLCEQVQPGTVARI